MLPSHAAVAVAEEHGVRVREPVVPPSDLLTRAAPPVDQRGITPPLGPRK